MEPTLEHHSVIFVDFQRTTRRRNKIFAVRTDDGPVVKRLQRTKGRLAIGERQPDTQADPVAARGGPCWVR